MSKKQVFDTGVACGQASPVQSDRWSDLFSLFRITGDNRYFAEILDGTYAELRRHAIAVCRILGLAEDFADVLLNEATLRLLRGAPGFDCRRPLLPYFKSIVTNCGRDQVRYDTRRRAKSLTSCPLDDDDMSLGRVLGLLPATIDDPAEQTLSNEAVRNIHGAVSRLPEPERSVMVEKINGSDRHEIAKKFGYKPQRVSGILCNARRLLRDELQ